MSWELLQREKGKIFLLLEEHILFLGLLQTHE